MLNLKVMFSISHFCSSPRRQFIYSKIYVPMKPVFRYYGGKFNQLKDILAILSNIAFAREMYSSKLNK